jgi:hypothetical protein
MCHLFSCSPLLPNTGPSFSLVDIQMSDAQTCLLNLFSIGRNFDHHEGSSVPPARTTSPGVMRVAWHHVLFLNSSISRQTYRRMRSGTGPPWHGNSCGHDLPSFAGSTSIGCFVCCCWSQQAGAVCRNQMIPMLIPRRLGYSANPPSIICIEPLWELLLAGHIGRSNSRSREPTYQAEG